jgi:hypothetical protein
VRLCLAGVARLRPCGSRCTWEGASLRVLCPIAVLVISGCAEDTYAGGQGVRSPAMAVEGSGNAWRTPSAPPAPASMPGEAARILVLQSTHLERPAEVVGVVDAHVPMGSHEDALDVLRRRALELGADAVVGVEFHHGEGDGQPTHLSGLAVRFLPRAPYSDDR